MSAVPMRDALTPVYTPVVVQNAGAEELATLLRERDQLLHLQEALAEVVQAVNASLDLSDVLSLITRHAVTLLRADGASVQMLRHGQLEVVAGSGLGARLVGMHVPLDGSLCGRAFRDQSPVLSNDAAGDPELYPPAGRAIAIKRTLIAPLASGSAALGVLSVINRDDPFTAEDAAILQRLCDQVAMAITNARLFEDARALAERYRRVVETTSDAIVMLDRERRIVFANPAAEQLFGTMSTVVGMPIAAFIPAELQERVAEVDAQTLAGVTHRYDIMLTRADGEPRYVSVGTAPLHDAGGVTGIVASLRDITSERRARDAVAHSESRYRNLFETATDAIYTLDARGAFTSANNATRAMSGRSADEMLGRRATEFLVSDDVPRATDHFRSALAGAARRFECRFVRVDGSERLLSVTNTPIRQGSDVVGVLGIARDVTEERQRAAALERSEARYTRLVETASDAIFTVDVRGVLTSVNRSMERSTGRNRVELLGLPFASVLDARDQAAAVAMLAETSAGHRRRGELRYRSGAGETRNCSLTLTPLVESGQVTGALGIVRDVTDEKRIAAQLMQQEKLAAMGQLVSGVAHELNNPLAGVTAFAQLLLAAPDMSAVEQRSAVETIDQEARRAAKIVSSLLTFARQRAPERAATDLNQVVSETIELRRYALRNSGIAIDTALDERLPATWADPSQIQQVILNILVNAEHAVGGRRDDARIEVSTSHRDGMLTVRVADNGPGIPAAVLPNIFNPFFTTKAVGAGTGLGLSISDGIIREHGGRIRAESPPGEGASFIIELPLEIPPASTPVDEAPMESPRVPRRNILVVDDEPALRSAMTAYFRSIGHAVTAVANGRDAIERAASQSFDAVLLDLRLPDTSGDMVLAELRIVAPDVVARTIFVTGDTQSEASRTLLEGTGRPVVSKPFLLDELGGIVSEVMAAADASIIQT